MKKHRSTVFTRLLFFLIIFLPLAFIGVTISKGKDPMIEFKRLIGQRTNSEESSTNYTKSSEDLTIEMQRKEIEILKKELEICKQSK